MQRELLFLSYLFPPRGGAGVQRALKFVKYLPEFGWKPLVVANGGTAKDLVTSVKDETLLRDLPAETVVRHTRLTEAEQRDFARMQRSWRRRLAPTDPMTWWVRPAVHTAMELYREHKPQAIFVTMSPFTAAEAGIRLKHLTGLPLILDLRDPWALDETKVYPTRWHAWRDWKAMERALRAADLVIMNTPEAERATREAFELPAVTRVISLTNGFDAEDFRSDISVEAPPAPRDVLRIVHTGMFHSELAEIWDGIQERRGWVDRIKFARRPINLWTRTPRYLLEAMDRLVRRRPELRGKIELVLAGEMSKADEQMIESSPVRDCVRVLGYQSHLQSVGWLRSADLLFLPLHTPLDGGPALIVPGKAYEYLGSGRPILAMGPPGDMRRFVTESAAGEAIDGNDVEGAADVLTRAHEAKLKGLDFSLPNPDVMGSFERRELSGALAEELDRLVVSARPAMAGRHGQEYLPMPPRERAGEAV